MVEGYIHSMDKKQRRFFDDFVKVCIYTTDEAFDALLGMRKIDYKMFKRLSEHLLLIDADASFFKFHDTYPEYAKKYSEEIESELSSVTVPKMTVEEEKSMKEELYEKIRKLYGNDAV